MGQRLPRQSAWRPVRATMSTKGSSACTSTHEPSPEERFPSYLLFIAAIDFRPRIGMRNASRSFRTRHGRRDIFAIGFMKVYFQNRDRRAGLSALAIVVAILAIGAMAKFDVATSLFRSVR
jgi:hypothetical protein